MLWVKRMREQPEYLLNDPKQSLLLTAEHRQINASNFIDKAQEQLKLIMDWNPGTAKEQELQSSWNAPVEVVDPLPEPSERLHPIRLTPKGPPAQPSMIRGELPSLPNTSTPSGGIVLPGAAPSTASSSSGNRPSLDPWSSKGPKIVPPGAVIQLGPSREKK